MRHPAPLAVTVALALVAVAAAGLVGMTMFSPTLVTARQGHAMPAAAIEPATAAASSGSLGLRRVPATPATGRATAQAHLVTAIVADLQTFWSGVVPALAGRDFRPLTGGLIAMDSAATAGTVPCVPSPASIVGNAFYCPSDDAIVYDSAALVPVVLHRYGPGGLMATFAHEFGHAIQAQIGPTAADRTAHPKQYPSLLIEAQGDCDAGAFLAWVVAGHAPHLRLGAAGMADAIGPLADFSDQVTVSATDSTAHGRSLDRIRWMLRGYRSGAATCRAMTVAGLHPTLGSVPLPPGGEQAMGRPRLDSTRAVVAAARRSVETFADGDAHTIAIDAGRRIDPAALSSAAPYGQFAEATIVALTAARPDRGKGRATPSSDENSVIPACFAGAWTRSVFGRVPAGSLGSWPGDADEALQAVRHRPGSTFGDVEAFVDGFDGGPDRCR